MKNIIIYDKNTKKDNFNNYGYGTLKFVKSCTVTEELNGRYDLEMKVYLNDSKIKYLTKWNILRAEGQLFRIYYSQVIEKENVISVKAIHIFYDLGFGFIEDSRCENKPMLASLQKSIPSQYKDIFTCNSDILESGTLYHVEDNGVTCVFNTIERWGMGELKRDNFHFEVNYAIGQDTGVTFTYKKIDGIEIINDHEKVATRIYPKGFDGITLPEKYIDIPEWNTEEYLDVPITKLVKFENAKTEVDLRLVANEYAGTVGISTSNITIKLHDITNTTVYNELKELYKANIGDIVTIKHSKLDIRVKVKIISITKEIVEGKVELELGQPLDDFLNSVDNSHVSFNESGLISQMTKFQQGMYYYTNNEDMATEVNKTISIGHIRMSLSENNNLMGYVSLNFEAFSEGVATFNIIVDNMQIAFLPKQKLLSGNNVVSFNFPLMMLQSGQTHTLEIRLDTTCITNILKDQFQLVVYGQFLEGGMGANSPYINEIEQPITYSKYNLYDEVSYELSDKTPNSKIKENISMSTTKLSITENTIIKLYDEQGNEVTNGTEGNV